MNITIDPSVAIGPVKPVNGVGQPPFFGLNEYPMFHFLKEAGIPFSRLHDVGGMFSRNVLVDIPNLFRDFDADENDPANYDFIFTDILINKLIENGVEPFYRLGVSIENYATTRRYRIDPPKDYAKWARICEHVIRHYTEGWADGFHHKITHWEIWNEPENWGDPERNEMWHGSFEQYCQLYGVASKHLKAQFPHLKIGGYASCGAGWLIGWKEPRSEHQFKCFPFFLDYIREHDCPLDFFSWHSYCKVEDFLPQARYFREKLDAAGYKDVPTCLNEWLPSPNHDKLGTALQAAEVAATLIVFQNGPVDSAAIYDARCGMGNYSPLFNPLTYGPHKAYYAFMAFNELRKKGTAVEIRERGADQSAAALAAGRKPDSPALVLPQGRAHGAALAVYSAAARGEDGSVAVMLANPGDEAVPVSLNVAGGASSSDGAAVPSRCRVVDDNRTWEEAPLPDALPPHSIFLVEY